MSDKRKLSRFERSLTGKSFRRYISPLTRKRINLLEHKQVNGNNQLIKYKQSKNKRTRKLLSYETEDTVSILQSLIKKGKDLLTSVSKEEKSLQNELEADVRNEQHRLQYIEEILGDETKHLHGSHSSGFDASAELDVETRTEPQLPSESEDSLVILSDNEKLEDIQPANDENYFSDIGKALEGESEDYSEGDSIGISEQLGSSIPDITMQDLSQVDNHSDENNDLLHDSSEVDSSEHSTEPTPHLKGTFMQGPVQESSSKFNVSAGSDRSEGEVKSEKADIPSDNYSTNNEEIEEEFIISEGPSDGRKDSEIDLISSQYSEDENFNEDNDASTNHSSEHEKPTEVKLDSHRYDSEVYLESDEAPPSDYNYESEQNQVSNVVHSEDKQSLQTSTLSDELTTIASQALAQLNAGNNVYEQSRDTIKEEKEPCEQNSSSDGEGSINEQEEIISEENVSSSEDFEAASERDDVISPSDLYRDNLKSDGIGELGEYSYQSDTNNNAYGLITDNDHSLLLKTLEQNPVSEKHDFIQENTENIHTKYPNDNFEIPEQHNIVFDLYTKDTSKTPNIEKRDELIKDIETSNMKAKDENSFLQQKQLVYQTGPKYTLTFSDSFSDEDSPQVGPTIDEKNAKAVYQPAFGADPFDSKSEGVHNEKGVLNDLLTTLGHPAPQKSEPYELSGLAQPYVDHVTGATPFREAKSIEQIEEKSFDNDVHSVSAEIYHDAVLFQSPFHNGEEADQNEGSSAIQPENSPENSPELTDDLIDEGTTKIPLFIDKETIRLATSPIRPPSTDHSVDGLSISSGEGKMTEELGNTKRSLEFQGSLSPHDIPIFNLNSGNITNNRSPVRTQGLQSILERTPAPHRINNKIKDARKVNANPYPALSSDRNNIKRSVPEIKIPLFVHRGESHEVASPFEDTAQTKTSTELSDYVESVMNEPNEDENHGPIVTEPLDVHTHARSVSFIEVEELISENIKDTGIEKISTQPEVLLRASPELIQDTVELEELVFEQDSHSEVEDIMKTENDFAPNPMFNEVTIGIGETTKITEQIELKRSVSIESAQSFSTGASANMNKTLIREQDTPTEDAVQGKINSKINEVTDESSNLSDPMHQRLSTFPILSMKQVNNDTSEESNSCKIDTSTGNDSNFNDPLKRTSLNSLANTKDFDNNDVSKERSPKPIFGRTILSSPFKVWHSLARGVKSIGDAATEFVGAVDMVGADSDTYSANSNQSESESEMSQSQSDLAALGDSKTMNSKTKQTELEPLNSKSELAEPTITDFQNTLQIMDRITNKTENPKNTDNYEGTTQQISKSIPSEVLVDDTIELSLAMSRSNSSTIEHEGLQTLSKEDSIPINVKSEEPMATNIPVTIGKVEPLQQRTPVKKRPRSTDTSALKSSKRKQKKKRRRARKITSVARNLRSKSKK